MAKKKIGILDMFTKENSYLSRASTCDVCGKEFLAEKNKYGKIDFSKCDFCKNDFEKHMKILKNKKKEEMKEMYSQNFFDITEVKKCEVCEKEYRSNISNCNTCNVCLRAEVRRKKGFRDAFRSIGDSYYSLYPSRYECTCLDCGAEYITNNIYHASRCDNCREEKKEHEKSYVGRAKETDFKCIVCNEFFKADTNKFMCQKCVDAKEKEIVKVSICKVCGKEYTKKNEDGICVDCIDSIALEDISVCKVCGKENFFGQACSCQE